MVSRFLVLAILLCIAAVACLADPAHATEARFGVIEIGGSGIKPSIVRIERRAGGDDEDGVGLIIEKEFPARNINPLFAENMDIVAMTVAAVVRDMRGQGISPLRIYVVGSSGIAALGHADTLRARVDRAVAGNAGALQFITSEQEARFAFNGVLNCIRLAHRRSQSVLIDIGSANVAAAYVATPAPRCGDEPIASVSFPWGVKLLERRAFEQPRTQFADAVSTIRTAVIVPDIDRAARGEAPGLVTLPRVYLGGGIVWAIATLTHPENRRRYIPLTAGDVERVRAQLRAKPDCITNFDMAMRADRDCAHLDLNFSSIPDPAARAAAIADHREIVASVFSVQQLTVGAEIVSAFAQRLDFAHRTVLFARPAKRAWMLGYILAREVDAAAGAALVPPQ